MISPDTATPSPKRKTREIVLISLVVILGCVATILFIVLVTKEGVTDDVCLMLPCVVKTSRLASAMNGSVDPCDDFYHYACGMWIRDYRNEGLSQTTAMHQEAQEQLRDLLEAPSLPGENTAVTKAKVLYTSCLDLEQTKNRSMDMFKPLIEQLGGWPVLDPTWNNKTFNLEDLLVNVGKYTNVIFDAATYKDEANRNTIMVQESTLSVNRATFFEPHLKTLLDQLLENAIDLAVSLGASNDTAISEMTDMIAFETELAKLTLESGRKDYFIKMEKMNIHQLAAKIPGFDWLRFLRGRFEKEGVKIDDKEPVLAYTDATYMKEVIPLIQRQERRTVANYIVWRLLGTLATEIRPAFQLKSSTFDETNHVQDSRVDACGRIVKTCMRHAASRMYVSEHLNIGVKKHVELSIGFLRDALKKLITHADWMDKATREYAVKKLQRMSQKIAFDDKIMNDTWLEKEYEDLSFKQSTYFENIMACSSRLMQETTKDLRKPRNNDIWYSSSVDWNAFYSPDRNEIILPAVVLQSPFFSEHFPGSVIFAGLGYIIGHEITHGFDVLGAQFDDQGHVKNWWTNQSLANFQRKGECIEKQYSNYSMYGRQVDGKTTLGENMADTGGLQAAYRAFRDWVAVHKEDKMMPGLYLTQDQIFFITYAQTWCTAFSRERTLYMMATGPHSPRSLRVRGPLSNSEDFARAFNCPPGSTMNPSQKCTVW